MAMDEGECVCACVYVYVGGGIPANWRVAGGLVQPTPGESVTEQVYCPVSFALGDGIQSKFSVAVCWVQLHRVRLGGSMLTPFLLHLSEVRSG